MGELFRSIAARQELLSAVILCLLIFARLVFAVFFTPFFGGRTIPARIKMGTALALVALLYPALSQSLPQPVPLNMGVIFLLFVKEVFIGLIMGMLMSMVFYGIQAAGQFIDNQRGISIAAIFNPSLGAQVSLMGQFLFQFSVVLFFIIGGHRLYVAGFFRSYEIIPLVTFPGIHTEFADASLQLLIQKSGQVLAVTIQLAAPIIIALFLAEMVLGIANRVAPQMDVLFISYTLKAMVGLIMTFLAFHLMAWQMRVLFKEHLIAVHELIKALPGI